MNSYLLLILVTHRLLLFLYSSFLAIHRPTSKYVAIPLSLSLSLSLYPIICIIPFAALASNLRPMLLLPFNPLLPITTGLLLNMLPGPKSGLPPREKRKRKTQRSAEGHKNSNRLLHCKHRNIPSDPKISPI